MQEPGDSRAAMGKEMSSGSTQKARFAPQWQDQTARQPAAGAPSAAPRGPQSQEEQKRYQDWLAAQSVMSAAGISEPSVEFLSSHSTTTFDRPRPSKNKMSTTSTRSKSSISRMSRQTVNAFPGFSFSESESNLASKSQGSPGSGKLPLFRPAQEVCKTYSHVFRLLSDPRVHGQRPQKKPPVHAVVRMPALQQDMHPMDMMDDEDEDDYYDNDPDAPPTLGAAPKWLARSGPDLTAYSDARTTTGPWRPGSGNRQRVSYDTPETRLPALSQTNPGKARMGGHAVPERGIDAEARRRPPELLKATF